ncbi:aldo/keto reductase family protein [Ceratobasidium sp. AG-Ba]|nr:aldo/keto reductase family protein [Ceratobasidium sp. AG-Ba]
MVIALASPIRPSRSYRVSRKKAQTKMLVIQAIGQGFRGVDTACQPKHYREDLVGEGLAEAYEKHGLKRDDIFIQTKYTPIGGHDTSQPIPYDPSAPVATQIRTSFSRSLQNLRTSWIDSYLLHSPLNTLAQTKEAWSTLCDLRKEGVVKMIGVSNTYDVETLMMLQVVGKVDVVQNRWYEGNAWDQNVHGYCQKEGIHYESFWTLTGSPSLLRNPLIMNIAKAQKCTTAQIVYKLAQSIGIIPLAGSTNEEHMKDGVEAERVDLEEHLGELKALTGN